jgi:hypothetical protein
MICTEWIIEENNLNFATYNYIIDLDKDEQ